MHELSGIGKKTRKYLFIAIVTDILSIFTLSIADNCEEKADSENHDVYYNATLFIITNLYYVKEFNEEEIDLSYRYPSLPGIFIIKDEEGIKEFNLWGGWYGTRIEIHNFNGFFKWHGIYTILIGKCAKISIMAVRT